MSEGSKKIFPVHFSPIYWQLNVEREREKNNSGSESKNLVGTIEQNEPQRYLETC